LAIACLLFLPATVPVNAESVTDQEPGWDRGPLLRAEGSPGPGIELDSRPAKIYFLIFRLYGPEKALLEKTWMLPDVEMIKQ
jgi:hypothetical protein